jgi:hypothetical protein
MPVGILKISPFLQNNLASITVLPPEEPPPSRLHEKDLSRAMRMQAIVAFWRLASSANIKPNCLTNVNVLIRTFRNAATNDGENSPFDYCRVCAHQ